MRFLLCVLVLGLWSSAAQAYDFGGGSIDIPPGFEGPTLQSMGQGGEVAAFTYDHGNGNAALLQITTFDPGQTFPDMSAAELEQGAQQYLLQFLGGVERRRNNFSRGPVEFVRVSGRPMARVSWRGDVQGKPAHGVMYCLIHNSRIYSFHTQDMDAFGRTHTDMAVSAFESIRLDG